MKKAIEELKRLQDKIGQELWANREAQRQVCTGINMCIGRLSASESEQPPAKAAEHNIYFTPSVFVPMPPPSCVALLVPAVGPDGERGYVYQWITREVIDAGIELKWLIDTLDAAAPETLRRYVENEGATTGESGE